MVQVVGVSEKNPDNWGSIIQVWIIRMHCILTKWVLQLWWRRIYPYNYQNLQ